MPKLAVLLVNLGSPASPSIADVRSYLREFLGDKRVIDLPAPLRWILLEAAILRTRPAKSAHAYASIWTEQGSPLMVTSGHVRRKLSHAVGPGLQVSLAMRYGNQPRAKSPALHLLLFGATATPLWFLFVAAVVRWLVPAV